MRTEMLRLTEPMDSQNEPLRELAMEVADDARLGKPRPSGRTSARTCLFPGERFRRDDGGVIITEETDALAGQIPDASPELFDCIRRMVEMMLAELDALTGPDALGGMRMRPSVLETMITHEAFAAGLLIEGQQPSGMRCWTVRA